MFINGNILLVKPAIIFYSNTNSCENVYTVQRGFRYSLQYLITKKNAKNATVQIKKVLH